MKGKLIAFASILCIASLIVSGANAKGKPDKPGDTKTELIIFAGDLVGYDDSVEGCCPNAGPFPVYGMTLVKDLGDFRAGYYEGYLFISTYGTGRDREYKVQFWNDNIAIEIIGGVIVNDKKNKVLTVTFTDESCVDLNTGVDIAEVNFVLTRTPS